MNEPLIVGILHNIAILITFVLIYDYIWVKDKTKQTILNKIGTGFVIGGMGILLMVSPWTMVPGLVFDTRSIMLAIAGLFFGPIPTIIAMLITSIYRISLGGSGMLMGVAVILTSGSLGILWRYIRPKSKRSIKAGEFYLLGIIVHIVMLGSILLLPKELQFSTFKNITITVLIIYPLGTLLLGNLLVNRIKNWDNKKALKESEERFKMLFDKAPIGYQSLDEDGHFIEVNESWLILMGYDREEVIGKWFGDFLAPQFVEPFRERFPLFKKLGKIHSEFEMVKKDEALITISFEGLIGYTASNQFKQTHCVLTDITERTKVEKALIESEERYRGLYEGANDAILILNGDKFIECNDKALLMFGCETLDDIAGHYPSEFSPDLQTDGTLSVEKAKLYLNAAMEGNPQRFEWRHTKKDGTPFEADVSLNTINSQNTIYIQSIVRDITHQKAVINALKDSEEKYRRITENAQDIIFRYDLIPYNRLTYINNAVMNLTGYTPAECLADQQLMFSMIYREDLPIMQNIVESLQLPEESFTLRWIDKSGSFHWMETRAVPIYDAEGNIIAVEGITRDVTNEKLSRDSLKASEEKYRLIYENAGASIGYFSTEGIILALNEMASLDLLGHPGNFIGKSIYECLNKERADINMQRILSTANSDNKIEYDECIDLPSGKKWLYSIYTNVIDENGEVTGVQIISQDITARKEAEIKLEHKMDELQRFNDLTVTRELKMVELKKEINELLNRLGEKDKYKIVK